MYLRYLALLTAFLCAPSLAADLESVDRTIAKEPQYRTNPQYCLLVFGREARTRVWLVMDGDVLYVDRAGTGDLTDPRQRVDAKKHRSEKWFEVGDITETDGKKRHASLLVTPSFVSIGTGARMQYARGIKFANRPQDAPVVHLNGPLIARLEKPEAVLHRGGETDLEINFGSVGRGAFATIGFAFVPGNVHPVAEIEFPAKAEGRPSVRTRVILAGRC